LAYSLSYQTSQENYCFTGVKHDKFQRMDILTVSQAAKELGISREAVYLAIREGRLTAVKILDKYGITRDELDKYQPVEARVKAQRQASSKRRSTKKGGAK
jgi:excisionase family DNA binding protein